MAVALLLFVRCVLLAKVGKSNTNDDNKNKECSQNVSDTAKSVETKVTDTTVRSKMTNGILNGSVSGLKCNMGTGVIPSHASVENLLANRKEYLKASADTGKSHDGAFEEEAEFESDTRPLAECAALLKTPVR